MSQVNSGRKRIKHDAYQTPEWATEVVLPFLPASKRVDKIWEPAAGQGKMAKVLRRHYKVVTTDIQRGTDFLGKVLDVPAIVTNPPFALAQKFIEHALTCTVHHKGIVAMLLRVDFDSAKTRKYLFANHTAFARKVVLTQRVRWIENSTGSPSENHAWYLWDWKNTKAPTIWYAP